MRVVHTWTELTASIGVEGLTRPLRVMHVADTHLDLIDDRDAQFVERCKGIAMRFAERHFYRDERGNLFSTEAAFEKTLREAKQHRVDLIVHSGDLLDFAAQASVDRAVDLLDGCGIPWLFASGDHDWFFFPIGLSPGLREKWWPVIDPLTRGKPACDLRDVYGIRFITVDDTVYQITDEQLSFVQNALADGLPSVVVMHIPLSIATLRPAVIERWRQCGLIGDPEWPLDKRKEFGTGADTDTTKAFVRTLTRADNLVAVLVGHSHVSHADAVHPRAIQYVAPPNYAGLYRLIDFHPLPKQ